MTANPVRTAATLPKPRAMPCGKFFKDGQDGEYQCNRPKGHKRSIQWKGKHWRWVGDRVASHEPFYEGDREITKKSNEPRW
jgi:hypothetical protein